MTDEQRRYKLYRFLNYYIMYGYNTSTIAKAPVYASQNFCIDFCKDTSLILTDSNISNFMRKFLVALEKANDNSLNSLYAAFNNADVFPYFTQAFNEIGVTPTLTSSILITFTMPNNSTKTMNCSALMPRINKNLRQEIKYAEIAYPITSFENISLEDISNLNFDCGTDSYLTFSNNRFTINGSGDTYGLQGARNNTHPFNTASSATTLIINKNITRLYNGAAYRSDQSSTGTSFTLNTIVFEHSNSDTLTLESGWIPAGKSSGSSKPTFNIYTDNDVVKNYSYSSNITVNIHPLSEWSG